MKQIIRILPVILIFLIFSVFYMSCSNKGNNKSHDTNMKKMKIDSSIYGSINDEDVFLYSIENRNGVIVKISTYGGIITSIIVPDREGKFDDIVLGFDSLSGYLNGHPYFGAIVGRYANRIAGGEFSLDGTKYSLARNNGENHLHGGISGFDKKLWKAESFILEDGAGVILTYLSPDMEEGYPGKLETSVSYSLTNNNELKISYIATTDKACPVNLTQHSYFNLSGGIESILGHELRINAGSFVAVNNNLIPTGELADVTGSPMDFLDFHSIGERISRVEGGYDHSYVLNKDAGEFDLSVEVYEPVSGRTLEMFTSEPAVQLYTGNFLDGSLTGKNDIIYNKHHGFCLEAQHFPDSPNHPEFPNTILRPGELYSQLTVYKFSTR